MDYSKSGAPKGPKNTPKFDAHGRHGKGAPNTRPGMNSDKVAFLTRIKAIAEAARAERDQD